MKRAFDFSAALLGLVLLSPVLLVIALAVKLTSPGGIFYAQTRVGLHGRHFKLYKFRSMVTNADKLGTSVTTSIDRRITPIGRFLRKTKLDELPQLWNVVRGDMSLVGPRPDVPEIVATYTDEMRRIFDVLPGMTSQASLYLRDEEQLLSMTDTPDDMYVSVLVPAKVDLAMEHVQRHSFWFDLLILFKTVGAVVLGRLWSTDEPVGLTILRESMGYKRIVERMHMVLAASNRLIEGAPRQSLRLDVLLALVTIVAIAIRAVARVWSFSRYHVHRLLGMLPAEDLSRAYVPWPSLRLDALLTLKSIGTIAIVVIERVWDLTKRTVIRVRELLPLGDSDSHLTKRAFDFSAALLGLVLLSPVLAVIALAVKLTSPGGIFYAQTRVGLHGRHFKLYKFRSMVTNADKLGTSVTTSVDRRITPIGRFLRKTKLDELPQLWNVVRGDMSLVGPRPDVPEIVATYTDEMRRIFDVLPGMTSQASLYLRDEEQLLSMTDTPDDLYVSVLVPAKVDLAMEHVQRHSFWFDLLILFKTVGAVVLGRLWSTDEPVGLTVLRQFFHNKPKATRLPTVLPSADLESQQQ